MNAIQGTVKVEIHNLLGQKLYETKVKNGNGKISLDLNPEWKGALVVTFEGEFGKVFRKILKL
jgi:hypothetical protein